MALERRKVVTLHAPLGKAISSELFEVIDITLRDVMEARAVWITIEVGSTDLVVMAEVDKPEPPPPPPSPRGRRTMN